jgi:hypothetical protein
MTSAALAAVSLAQLMAAVRNYRLSNHRIILKNARTVVQPSTTSNQEEEVRDEHQDLIGPHNILRNCSPWRHEFIWRY